MSRVVARDRIGNIFAERWCSDPGEAWTLALLWGRLAPGLHIDVLKG